MSKKTRLYLGLFMATIAVACLSFSKLIPGLILLFFALPFVFHAIGEVYVFVTLMVVDLIFGTKAANSFNAFCHKWLGFGV